MTEKKIWRAVVGITDDAKEKRYEPGDLVPDELLKRAPHLVKQGKVE